MCAPGAELDIATVSGGSHVLIEVAKLKNDPRAPIGGAASAVNALVDQLAAPEDPDHAARNCATFVDEHEQMRSSVLSKPGAKR